MILDATNKSIKVVLGEAKTTTDCDVTASWEDITATAFTPGASDTATNGTTAVTAVASPASSTQRRIKELTVWNNDTVSHLVKVQYVNNATTRVMFAGTLNAGDTLVFSGGLWSISSGAPSLSSFLNYLSGLITSWVSTTTFTVGVGAAMDVTNTTPMQLATALTKSTSSWAVGTAAGGLDTGAIASSTWYHVYLIRRPDTGVVDVLYSTSASAPTMPSNYTQKRRIGSVKTDGSSHFLKWVQNNDNFMWDTPVADVNATNPGTSAVTRTLTVPTGVIVEAVMAAAGDLVNGGADALGGVYLSDLATADIAASFAAFTFYAFESTSAVRLIIGTQAKVNTNTSAQIRSRCGSSGSGSVLAITTLGWNDQRGKNG